MKPFLLTAALVIGFVQPLQAFAAEKADPQKAAAATKIGSDQLNTAEQLVRTMNLGNLYEETMRAAMMALATELRAKLMAEHPEIQALEQQKPGTIATTAYDVMGESIKTVMRNTKGALMNEFAKIYARNFSIEDMQAAIKFYSSPAGQRILAATPELTAEAISLSQVVVTPRLSGITEKGIPQMIASLKQQAANPEAAPATGNK